MNTSDRFDLALKGASMAILPASFDRPPDPRPPHSLADLRLCVDLGDKIGSPDWFRGAATLGALLVSVVHFAPTFQIARAPVRPQASAASARPAMAIGRTAFAPGPSIGSGLLSIQNRWPLERSPNRPQTMLSVTPKPKERLETLLVGAGVTKADALQASALIAGAAKTSRILPGSPILITFGKTLGNDHKRQLDQITVQARLDLSLTVRRVTGTLALDRYPRAVDERLTHIVGRVGSSLYTAQRAAGIPSSVVGEFFQAINPYLELDQIDASDAFDVVFERPKAMGGAIQSGRLLYAGVTHSGRPLRLVRSTDNGRTLWFDVAGRAQDDGGFSMPVSGARMSSGFGMRVHPILGFSRMHQGVDLAAPDGTPIVAATDGVVRFAGWHGGHGNFVQIDHSGDLGTGYGHMSAIIVRPGESVRRGQLIGYVGSTGLSTGPHCHFEVYRHGIAIDPATARYATVRQLTGHALRRLRATIAKLTALPVVTAARQTLAVSR